MNINLNRFQNYAQDLMIIPIILKSFFMAVTQVAWGIVSIVALKVALIYALKGDLPISINETFLYLTKLIVNNLMIFVWIFFAIYIYFDLNEFLKLKGGK